MRTHTGEKPFPCTSCDSTFATKSGLHRHEAHIHTTVKPYKCDLCDYAGGRPEHLKNHRRVVHGVDITAEGKTWHICHSGLLNILIICSPTSMHGMPVFNVHSTRSEGTCENSLGRPTIQMHWLRVCCQGCKEFERTHANTYGRKIIQVWSLRPSVHSIK